MRLKAAEMHRIWQSYGINVIGYPKQGIKMDPCHRLHHKKDPSLKALRLKGGGFRSGDRI
jgi:Mn-dependent DtxR family transcriptional regulator